MTTKSMAAQFSVKLESNCSLFLLEINFFSSSICKFKVQANYAGIMFKMNKFGSYLLNSCFFAVKD